MDEVKRMKQIPGLERNYGVDTLKVHAIFYSDIKTRSWLDQPVFAEVTKLRRKINVREKNTQKSYASSKMDL